MDRRYIPEIRNEVGAEDLEETKLADRVVQSSSPEHDADIRNDDLTPLIGREHGGTGVEV